VLTGVDLTQARGLETVNIGPHSAIGIDTIYKSRGKIPDVFLRGCGVPDELIAYIGAARHQGRPQPARAGLTRPFDCMTSCYSSSPSTA
jgi:hypothetical protein